MASLYKYFIYYTVYYLFVEEKKIVQQIKLYFMACTAIVTISIEKSGELYWVSHMISNSNSILFTKSTYLVTLLSIKLLAFTCDNL